MRKNILRRKNKALCEIGGIKFGGSGAGRAEQADGAGGADGADGHE